MSDVETSADPDGGVGEPAELLLSEDILNHNDESVHQSNVPLEELDVEGDLDNLKTTVIDENVANISVHDVGEQTVTDFKEEQVFEEQQEQIVEDADHTEEEHMVEEEEKQNERQDDGEQLETGISVRVANVGDPDINNSVVEEDQSDENVPVDVEYSSDLPQPYSVDAAATVRFLLMPSQQVATQRCLLSQTVSELKQLFAVEMKLSEDLILVVLEGKQLADDVSLGHLGVVPNGTIQLELHSRSPVEHPLKLVRPRVEYHMPDVITVRIHVDRVHYRDVVVEIERATSRKPFIGGYRHKVTGVEYHHAVAQTVQKPRPSSNVQRFCRDTQTSQQRNINQQTANETSTQMTKIGVYVSAENDRLLKPRPYTTAEDHHRMVITKVIIIQKYYRRWLATKYVDQVRANQKRREDWERQEEINKIKEKEDRIKKEYARRMNPKSKQDFNLLYHALEKWRQGELARIDSTLSGAERKAALCQLLDHETQLLASVERHKLDADSENKQLFIKNFLEKMSMPKKWVGPDGKETSMDTPHTLRARQLRDVYYSINMNNVTLDERLDALLTLKHTIKEHDCKLTKEIAELVDREANLLVRGIKEPSLDALRKRISTLFLQYIKTPSFNPEASKFSKAPQDLSVLKQNIHYCPGCSRYLPSTEFKLSTNSKAMGRCQQCLKTNNIAISRQDLSHYSYMLKQVCQAEEAFSDGSKIAFLMQESDIHYLVEKIWDNQSVLSACGDLYELVMVRWNRDEEWSPWNCVLLTKDEVAVHEKVSNLEEGYGADFLHKINNKHTMAKNYFFRLPVMATRMRSTHVQRSATDAGSHGPLQPSISQGQRTVQSSA